MDVLPDVPVGYIEEIQTAYPNGSELTGPEEAYMKKKIFFRLKATLERLHNEGKVTKNLTFEKILFHTFKARRGYAMRGLFDTGLGDKLWL